jgi:hypothetical protein
MWLRLSNARDEFVVNEDHIKRLLAEGAVEIPDPRSEFEDALSTLTEGAVENEQASLGTNSSDEELVKQISAQKKSSKRASKSPKD